MAVPADLTGKTLWLRAKDQAGSGGSAVTALTDQSGNSRTTVITGGTKAPTVAASSTPSGGKSIRCNSSTIQAYALGLGSGGGEMWMVVKSDGGSDGSAYAWKYGTVTGGDVNNYYPYAGVVYDDFGSNVRRNFVPTVAVTSWRLYYVRITSAGVWSAYIDNALQLSASGASLSWRTDPYIVGAADLGGGFKGNIAELLVRTTISTSGEVADLVTYFNTEHGLTVPGGSTPSGVSITSPTATATASSAPAALALSALLLTSPTATATAGADPATAALGALNLTSPTATATAQANPAAVTFGTIDLTSPTAAATADAAPGVVTVGGLALTSPQATATATAIPAVVTFGAIALTSPTATATASAAPAAIGLGGHLNLTSPTATAHAAAVPAHIDGGDLAGWVADLTGRALIGVTASVTDLYVPGAVVDPPAGVDVRPILRNSHQMPPLSALQKRYRDDEYTVLDEATLGAAATVGTWHVWVDGVDRTYDDDGELLDIDDLVSEKGFGDRSARLDVKRIQIWHESGDGDYSWLRAGAKVEAGIVHPDGTRTILFAGDLISDDAGSTPATFENTWTVQGTLVQAMQSTMQPLDEMPPTQVGVVAPRVLNAITSRRFPKVATLATPGVETRKLGSYAQKVGDYVKTLLATAWDGDSQLSLVPDAVNRRQYRPAWTDTATLHWTISAGAPGVSVRLSEDWSQVENCIYGRGTMTNGHRWFNRRFPYLLPYTPPTYFSGDTSAELLLGSTDAGTINNGVSLLQRRLQELGYHDVKVTGTFDLQTLYAVRRIQTVRGLLVDGRVGGQTWTSIWAVGATGADLRSVRLPLWVDPRVEPWLYLPNGAIAEPNPAYVVGWPRVEVDIDYGDNTTLAVGIADATQRGLRLMEPGLVGNVTLGTDFWEGSRFLADFGHNVNLLGWRGADRTLHVASRAIKRKAGLVDLTVDSKFRDALTVREVMARNAESAPDPARRPGAIGRTSSTTAQDFTLFDGDSPAGIIPELTLRGGLWSVWPFPLDRAGTLAKVIAETWDPVTRFVLLLFGQEVLPSQLHARLGNSLVATRQWSDPAIDAWLTANGFITGWGQQGEACGFYPGSESEGDPVTGEFVSASPVTFVSKVKGFAWAAVLPESDCRFKAEFEPQAKG